MRPKVVEHQTKVKIGTKGQSPAAQNKSGMSNFHSLKCGTAQTQWHDPKKPRKVVEESNGEATKYVQKKTFSKGHERAPTKA